MAIRLNSRTKAPPLAARRPADSTAKTGITGVVAQWAEMFQNLGKRVSSREIIFFTSQLSLMLEIGTPLNSALRALRDQTKNPAFKEVIQSMLRDVEEGRQLSMAMRRHPRIFNNIFVSLIKAGETGGFLKDIIDRIVEMQEKRQALLTQAKAALTYPIILCVVGILVVVFVLVAILPRFATFFQGKEQILPMTTRFMMAMSHALKDYWWAYLLGAAVLIIAFKFFLNSKWGKFLFDLFCVKAPFISRLFNKIYTSQILRTLGHLMESQVPLLEALLVCRDTLRNRYFTDFIDRISEHVSQGGKFSQPFSTNPYIMDTVKQMVVTADETGNLPRVMLRLAEFYDTEVEHELKGISSIIEPVGLIVMGGVVGLIVSSVILPMFRLAQAMH